MIVFSDSPESGITYPADRNLRKATNQLIGVISDIIGSEKEEDEETNHYFLKHMNENLSSGNDHRLQPRKKYNKTHI